MAEQRFQILIDGYDPERREALAALLARVTGRSATEMSQALDALPVAVGWALDADSSDRLYRALERVGAGVRLVPAAPGEERAVASQVLAVELPASAAATPPPAAGDGPAAPAPPVSQGRPPGGPRGGGAPLPLGLGRRLAWSFRLVRRNKWPVLALWVTWAVASGVLTVLFGGLVPAMQSQTGDLAALVRAVTSPLSLLGLAVGGIGSLLLWSWLQAALLMLPLRWFEQGAPPAVGTLMRQAWSRAPGVAAATVLVAGATMLVALAPLPVVGLQPASAAAAAPLLLSVGLAVVLGVGLALVLPAAANESLPPVAALRRGWRLARHRWGRIAVSGVAFALTGIVGLVLLQALLAALTAAVAAIAPLAALAVPVLMFLLMSVAALVLAVAGVFLVSLLYVEARVEGDGWHPPWRVLPHPRWPRSEGAVESSGPAEEGGAWRDFALVGGAGAAAVCLLLVWGAGMLPHTAPVDTSANAPAGVVVQGGAATGRPAVVAARDGAAARGGPEISMRIDTFFPSRQDPQVWIKVTAHNLMAGLPVLPEDYVRLRVHAVRDAGGRNRFNAGSSFESEFFERLQWSGDLEGGEAQALRTVHLLPGTQESDIAEVDGELIVSRPVGVSAIDLGAPDLGRARAAAGRGRVTLVRLEDRTAVVDLAADDGVSVTRIVGLGRSGAVLVPRSTVRSGHRHTLAFAEPVAGLRVYLQRGVQAERRAFVLRPGREPEYSVPTQWAGAVPAKRAPAAAKPAETMNIDELAEAAYQAYMAGRYREAIPYLDRLVTRNPHYAWGYYLRGESYWRLGRTELAYRDVATACDRGYQDACRLRR